MADHAIGRSPLVYARAAGIAFLIVLGCAAFSMMYVPSTLVVPGDATTTANNIMASELLYRMGMVSDSILFLSEIVLTVILYVLLRPVSKTLSLVAAFARLAMTVMQGTNLVLNLGVLSLLSRAGHMTVFGPDQLHSLALLLLDAHSHGALVWQMFFGLHCLVLGYLIFKAGYFPRILGVLMVFASLGYLADSLGGLLSASYQERFAWIVYVTSFVGEFPFFVWLLFKGVDVQKWEERATAGR